MLVALLASQMAAAPAQADGALQVESNAAGEIEVDARGAALDEVLSAIASKAGFQVAIESGIQRPPVNLAVPMAPVEEVLRQILRGRNYALIYDAHDSSLDEVIVLRPSTPGYPSSVRRRAWPVNSRVRRR
jgi:hypothetical protein